MMIRKTLSHIPCADTMVALQDAWSVLKNEPVEKGIFDRFRKPPEEPEYEVLGTTSPEPFTSEQPPEPEMPLEEAQQLMGETPSPQVKNPCENCKMLEKQLKKEKGTNDALNSRIMTLDFKIQQLQNRRRGR